MLQPSTGVPRRLRDLSVGTRPEHLKCVRHLDIWTLDPPMACLLILARRKAKIATGLCEGAHSQLRLCRR